MNEAIKEAHFSKIWYMILLLRFQSYDWKQNYAPKLASSKGEIVFKKNIFLSYSMSNTRRHPHRTWLNYPNSWKQCMHPCRKHLKWMTQPQEDTLFKFHIWLCFFTSNRSVENKTMLPNLRVQKGKMFYKNNFKSYFICNIRSKLTPENKFGRTDGRTTGIPISPSTMC